MKLELKNITKTFGSFVANDSISFAVNPGEIHVLLGENGAGKSTLMNVLCGLYKADSGDILLDGKKVTFANAAQSMQAGIGMVHQHFMLVPVFTVAQNVVLGHEKTKFAGIIDLDEASKRVRKISEKFGFDVSPNAMVEDLPVGVKQRVEIIKALTSDAKILILDEPTAVLTPQETDELMEIMRGLKKDGMGIIFITHKLREVKAVADKVTIIRHGKVVGSALATDSEAELASKMVGRQVSLQTDKQEAKPGNTRFKVENLTLIDDDDVPVLDDISFELKSGEILGVAGVQGNGQTELAQVLMGLKTAQSGSILLENKDITKYSVKKRLRQGIGFIPEDRNTDGLIDEFAIFENLVLDQYDEKPYSKNGILNFAKIMDNAKKLVHEYDIRLDDISDKASQLSGGNQQKVVVARELNKDLKLFIASQPTRGVDVGSIEFIHKAIISQRDKGVSVLLISSELDEIYDLADKIAVMSKGRIIDIVPSSTPRNVVGLMMTGFSYEKALEENKKTA